jgi:hypothetical protein
VLKWPFFCDATAKSKRKKVSRFRMHLGRAMHFLDTWIFLAIKVNSAQITSLKSANFRDLLWCSISCSCPVQDDELCFYSVEAKFPIDVFPVFISRSPIGRTRLRLLYPGDSGRLARQRPPTLHSALCHGPRSAWANLRNVHGQRKRSHSSSGFS